MNSAIDRIRTGAMVFGGTLLAATVGYHFLFARSWVNALYMVVITVTSVGFTDTFPGEQPPSDAEKLFTIGVIAVGLTAGAYVIGGFLQLVTEGEIQRAMGRRKITMGIDRLKHHIIICGFGRIGQLLAHDLKRQGIPFVLVESSTERVEEALALDYLVFTGNATEEDILEQVGIRRAKSLVTSLPSDADNVFITLTARNLNPSVQIIARAEQRSSEKKLLQAGANRVVMPASTGAVQMAQMITRPAAADFFELLADRTKIDLELDEVQIPPGGSLIGKTVGESQTHSRHRLLVLAVKPPDGPMLFNPAADYRFGERDTLIVMGGTADIDQFEREFRLES